MLEQFRLRNSGILPSILMPPFLLFKKKLGKKKTNFGEGFLRMMFFLGVVGWVHGARDGFASHRLSPKNFLQPCRMACETCALQVVGQKLPQQK